MATLAVTAALLLPLGACDEADADAGAEALVVDSAGVTLVTSGAEDRPLDLIFEAEYRLGGGDDEVESFYRVNAYNVAVSDEGMIAVLDADNHRVVVFDSAGEHVRTVGREGEGPGEITWPVGIFWSVDGGVMVQDIGKRHLVGYDRDGEPFDGPRLPDEFRGGRVHSGEAGLHFVVNGVEPREQRLMRQDEDGESVPLVTRALPPVNPVQFESCGLSVSDMPPLFTPQIRWAPTPDAVAVVDGAEYAVDLYRDGRLSRSVRRDVAPRPANLELAIGEVGEAMRVRTGSGELECQPDDVAEERGFAEVIPAIERLALAPDGTLWVGRWSVGDGPVTIDLFDPEGVYQGTFPAGTPFPVGFLPDGRVLWTETDDFEVERLVVGRLVATDDDGSAE